MKDALFTGVCTALVTPFSNGHIHYDMVEKLLSRQIKTGVEAIVISGTTGESPTLSDKEKIEFIRRSKDFVQNNCTIIAGTGSNSTEHTITLSKKAQDAGADALLIVAPYYNKPTPAGLITHFTTIAGSVDIPIIIYNVPSRTGIDIPVDVYKKLSAIENIAGVKESSADITKITRICQKCPKNFCIWSGNDDMTVPIISMGGKGVISVLSNVLPCETVSMTNAAIMGDFKLAASLQCSLQSLIDLLFSESNPIPVKAAMKLIGYDCGSCRPPLADMCEDKLLQLKEYFA